jgi:hypothetical protein
LGVKVERAAICEAGDYNTIIRARVPRVAKRSCNTRVEASTGIAGGLGVTTP